MNAGWDDGGSARPSRAYTQQDRIDQNPVINYGATESNANNPFHSTNPFASDVSASLVQPPARDDYTHDVMSYAAGPPIVQGATTIASERADLPVSSGEQPYGWHAGNTATEGQQWD